MAATYPLGTQYEKSLPYTGNNCRHYFFIQSAQQKKGAGR